MNDERSLMAGINALRMGYTPKSRDNLDQIVCPPWTRRDIGDMLAIRDSLNWLIGEVKSGYTITEELHGWTIRNIDALHVALNSKERGYLAKAGFNPNQPRVPAGSSNGGEWTDGGSGSAGQQPAQPPRRNIIRELFGTRPAYGGQLPKPKALNVDKSVDYLRRNISPKQYGDGKCATNVANAIRAGGIPLGRPATRHSEGASAPWALDYGPVLEDVGFSAVAASDASGLYPPKGYTPQKSDVAVIQPIKGQNPAGHMAMYDGTQWISDFKQHRDIWPNYSYQKNGSAFVIYRHDTQE